MSSLWRRFSSSGNDSLPSEISEAINETPGGSVSKPILEKIFGTMMSYLPVSVTELLGMMDFSSSQKEQLPWTQQDTQEFHVVEKKPLERRASVRGGKILPIRMVQDVGQIKTELILWETDEGENVEDVFIIIPGNPGLAEFYLGLLEHVYQESDKKVTCVGVTYAAHSQILRKPVPPTFKHTLEEQIQHKIDVFDLLSKEWYPKARFWIAGHSIGGYVSLRLLQARPELENRIRGVFGLFPTVEEMKGTPNGQRLSPLFKPGVRNAAASLIGGLAQIIPTEKFVDITQRLSKTPRQLADVVGTQLLHHDPLMSVLTMADCEMNEVTSFNQDLMRGKLDRIVLYYGEDDEWAPKYLAEGMQERFPDGKILIDKHKLPHAFMLHPHGQDIIGHYILEWMKEILKQKPRRDSVVKMPLERRTSVAESTSSKVDANKQMFRRRSIFDAPKPSRSSKDWVVEAKRNHEDQE